MSVTFDETQTLTTLPQIRDQTDTSEFLTDSPSSSTFGYSDVSVMKLSGEDSNSPWGITEILFGDGSSNGKGHKWDARYYSSDTSHGSYEIYHAVKFNSIHFSLFSSKDFTLKTIKG